MALGVIERVVVVGMLVTVLVVVLVVVRLVVVLVVVVGVVVVVVVVVVVEVVDFFWPGEAAKALEMPLSLTESMRATTGGVTTAKRPHCKRKSRLWAFSLSLS
jgi:hypothetical protein